MSIAQDVVVIEVVAGQSDDATPGLLRYSARLFLNVFSRQEEDWPFPFSDDTCKTDELIGLLCYATIPLLWQ